MKNPSDARAVRSRQRILDAATELMVEGGVGALSIKAIAERAGVQRSTIYNHWDERSDLVYSAIERLAVAGADVEDGAPVEGLDAIRGVVRSLGRNLGSDWGVVAASLAASAEHEEDLAEAHRDFIKSARSHLADLIAEQTAAGNLRSDIDPAWAVGILVGPLYYERLVMHRGLSHAEIETHLDTTIGVLT